MKILLAMFAVLVRLLRPTRGVHADPLGYVRGLAGEARRRRASRVRRYVQDLPVLTEPVPEPEPGSDVVPVEEDVPVVPGPRRPADDVLSSRVGKWPGQVAEMDAAVVAHDLVRGYYRAWEQEQGLLCLDRSRLGLAVLMEMSASELGVEVSA